jgi:hypothetical protein
MFFAFLEIDDKFIILNNILFTQAMGKPIEGGRPDRTFGFP